MAADEEPNRLGRAEGGGHEAWRTLAWGLGGALVAVMLRAALEPLLSGHLPYITIFPAAVIIALARGWGAGFICLAVATPILLFMFVGSGDGMRLRPGEATGLILILAVSVLLIGIAASSRRQRMDTDRAAAAARRATDQLRDSEERFRSLAELSPDAILVIAGGHIVYANDATLRLLRAVGESQVLGRSPLELVHPESRATVAARMERILSGEVELPLGPEEQRYTKLDGEEIVIEAYSTLVPWQGRAAIQTVVRDITERKKAELELRESKQELEDFFENSPIAIHWVGPDGRILRANRAELQLLGYEASEYIGRPICEFHANPADGEVIFQRLLRGEAVHHQEATLRRKDGALRQILLDVNALWRHGKFIHTRCFSIDITEQRRNEEAVRSALERFRLCARATKEPIYDWDLSTGRIEWSDALGSLAGESPSDQTANRDWWRRRVHPDDLSRLERSLAQALRPGGDEQWTAEYRFRRGDGTYGTVLDRAFIARDAEGNAQRIVGAMIDMTQRRLWEEELARRAADLERSNADLEDFARVISHDLKEPLRGIADYAGYLTEDYAARLDEDGRDKLHTLVRLSGRMHDLLDALMEYARVGRAELLTADLDLNQVLRDVLDSLRTRLEREHAQVVLAAPLPQVRGDPILISQVFTNLIVNGLKYNTKPDKRLEIGCVRREDGEAVIFIRDNGIGIDERHHEAIFQMFRRLHTRDKFGGGTGSGLSIVRKIVERHGGRIWVQSRVGEGSTFFMTLGISRQDPEPPRVETIGPHARQPSDRL
jgi:PAS domain S-box-containing protein